MSTNCLSIALRGAVTAALWGALCLEAQPDILQKSQELIAAGNAKAAFELLSEAEVNHAGEREFDLAFAAAANEAGEFTRAIMALERVLATDPGNERGRAEMGRALYGVGDHKGARKLLSESKAQGLTAIAGEPVEQMLHAIDRTEADGRSSARGWLEASVGWDSNINSAPGVSNVAVPAYGGSILAVDPAGTRRKGAFASIGAGGSGRLVLGPRASLIGSVNLRRQDFGDGNSSLRNSQADASVGWAYRVERHEFSVATQAGTYSIDGARVRDHVGAAAEWTYRLDGFRQFNAYVQTGHLVYPTQRIADADRHVIGFTYANLSTKGTWLYGGGYAGVEQTQAGSEHLGHHLEGVRGGLQMPIGASLGFFMAAGWERRRYGGRDPLFLTRRRDSQANVSAGVSWAPSTGWRVTPQVGWAKTTSTVPLAVYSKLAVSAAVRRDF